MGDGGWCRRGRQTPPSCSVNLMSHTDELPRDKKILIKPMENGYILIARYLAIKIPYKTNGKSTIFDREVARDQNTL